MDRNAVTETIEVEKLVVALRKESVDRNDDTIRISFVARVALRKESVDRNCYAGDCATAQTVALRKESVDRNKL